MLGRREPPERHFTHHLSEGTSAMSTPSLTHERLKSVLDCDPKTGIFKRRKATAARGHEVGDVMANGYLRIGIDRKRYLAHRLAWFYVHGVWPTYEVDHKNRVKTDNRIKNLRDATPSMNQHNRGIPQHNTTGYQGVSFEVRTCKWVAQIVAQRKHHFLGRFNSPQAAHEAYLAAKRIHHPTAPI